jgi:ribosomal protein S27AE
VSAATTETPSERAKRARTQKCPKCSHDTLMTHDDLWTDNLKPGVVQKTWSCSYCGYLQWDVVEDWREQGRHIDVAVAALPDGLKHAGLPYRKNPYWRQCTVEEVDWLFGVIGEATP